MPFPSSEEVLKDLFSKHDYLKMRRVSQDKLKPTKLALQLNEEEKTQKGGLSVKKDNTSFSARNNNILYMSPVSMRRFKCFI